MSRSEDYLDNLLTSVTDRLSEFDDDFEQNRESLKESYQTQNDLPSKTQSALDEIREENFLREFEDELHRGGSDDSFLRDFERELSGEEDELYQSPVMDDYTDEMEQFTDDTGLAADSEPAKMDMQSQQDADLEDFFADDVTVSLDQESSPEMNPGSETDTVFSESTESIPESFPDQDDVPDLNDISELNDVPELNDIADQNDIPDLGGIPDQNDVPDLSDIPDLNAIADQNDTQDFTMDTLDFNEIQESAADTGEEGIPQMASEQDKSTEAPEGMEGLEDIFGDLFDEETASLLEELGDDETAVMESETVREKPADDSLTQILGESDDEAISEINRMLDTGLDDSMADAGTVQDQDTLPSGPDFSYEESAIPADDTDKNKKKKEKNPNGLFSKLSRVLFGTPEELNPEAAAEYEAAKAAMGESAEQDAKARKEKKKQEKELKKQQKQEEAEKKKQEKEAAKAEKAAKKASKPKKEKKPKQKGPKEPPLPKVPVTMMWIIALSMMVLIFLGTVLLGYSVPVGESKEAFDNGDYLTAYAKLKGVKVKPEDENLLNASSALAAVQSELDAYTALMEQKQYEMALDSLIRGYGRCQIHSAEAEEWGVEEQLKTMEDKFDLLLKEQFDVSKRKAKKLYSIKKRSDYTLELHEILEKLGLRE